MNSRTCGSVISSSRICPKNGTMCSLERLRQLSAERSRTAAIAPELIDPGCELVSVEPQILPELHVGNAVRPRPLVEPAHRYSQEVGGFLNCQPGHRNSQSPLSRGGAAVSLMGSQKKASALPSARITA